MAIRAQRWIALFGTGLRIIFMGGSPFISYCYIFITSIFYHPLLGRAAPHGIHVILMAGIPTNRNTHCFGPAFL